MKTYQTLSLIGCIIGILLTLFLWGILGIGSIANDVSLNLTKQYGITGEDQLTQQTHDSRQEISSKAINGVVLALFVFIALIPITFIIGKVKVVGVSLLILGLVTVGITNLWGIIPFALLLPAGILAIRYKASPTQQLNYKAE